jgi:hypothetical protein
MRNVLEYLDEQRVKHGMCGERRIGRGRRGKGRTIEGTVVVRVEV